MKTINEIIADYTSGKVPVDETNAALKEAKANFHFEPGKNVLTEKEIRATTVGNYPNMANGYGLLDSGTGSMEKVHVVNGKLDFSVNQLQEDGTPNMRVYVHICGKVYEVFGADLGNIAPTDAPWWAPYHTFAGAVDWQDEIDRYVPEKDMMFRPQYSGQQVVKGGLRYIYDGTGNAKYQPKSMGDYDKDHGRG